MGKRRKPVEPAPPAPPAELERPDDHGFSLEELGQAYAEALAGGQTPYSESTESSTDHGAAEQTIRVHEKTVDEETEVFSPLVEAAPPAADEHCDLTPESILEAILFVGRPDNEPIGSAEIARLMRGVRPAEVDELIVDLNRAYDQQQAPYTIASVGAGYRMELRPEYESLCRRVYGKVKEVRLSQAAIDCLAIVAYKQPVRRDEIDRLRGKSSGGPLALLVRRGLVRLERAEPAASRPSYRTTQRFLEIFRLERLEDLPQAQQIEAD